MSRERTPAGNILALARSREDQASEVEEAATSYMPTSLDLDKLMPDEPPHAPAESLDAGATQHRQVPSKSQHRERTKAKGRPAELDGSLKRKRISLYLDDDVLTKIFRVSLERHEQLSSATHRLILEALKARGM
jgi:hypothetical protein